MSRAAIAAAVLAAGVLAGCAAPVLRGTWADAGAIELAQTPFFAQSAHQCGPAALATLLVASGVQISPEQLVSQVLIPDREGSLQIELAAAARRHGRVPILLKGETAALAKALTEGFPVLVLQNLGLAWWPRWHYAVVIGLDPVADQAILRSGVTRRLEMSARRFIDSWTRAGRWALVLADPLAPPALVGMRQWLEAVHDSERALGQAAALAAYTAASTRWPDEALVWQVLGNARYAAGDRSGAVAAYRRALDQQPLSESYNNLAHTLGELGCVREALAVLNQGLGGSDARWRPVLEQTRSELAQLEPRACVD